MSMLKKIYNLLTDSNVRTDGVILPLTTTPTPVILLCAAYLLFVLKIGPQWMKSRAPFEVKNYLIVYNIIQIIVNAHIFLSFVYFAILLRNESNLHCIVKFPTDHPQKFLEIYYSYMYYMLKIFDFADTIFFVLRKNFKQITPLHVYHHTALVVISYIYIRSYGYGGHAAIMGIVNALTHSFMYGYYLCSALQVGLRNNIWWKKYITIVQIVQFIVVFCYMIWPLLMERDCEYPKSWLTLCMMQALLFLYMFTKFYIKTYVKGNAGREKIANEQIGKKE